MRINFFYIVISLILFFSSSSYAQITTGAEHIDKYLPKIEGKRVAILANHTSLVGKTHLVDTLKSLNVDIKYIFAPEHGFRGTADAGENISNTIDKKTGVRVVSLYGSSKRPQDSIMQQVDVVIFDLQDVGLRFFTYLSSLHYLMESAADNQVELIILDRPNPNGFYVDGPTLNMKYKSFVGIYPIPVVHGMTLGELAYMSVGEGWLKCKHDLKLTVIECEGYTRDMRYSLPVKPSPNLPNMRSIYLYPSMCYFEATPISLGRGTNTPFEIYGSPDMKGCKFSFTPQSRPGAQNPPLKGKLCYGVDLTKLPLEELTSKGVSLEYLIDAYHRTGGNEKFLTSFFEKLIGVDYVRPMIISGASAEDISQMWAQSVEDFKEQRKEYLIYK